MVLAEFYPVLYSPPIAPNPWPSLYIYTCSPSQNSIRVYNLARILHIMEFPVIAIRPRQGLGLDLD